MSQVPLEFHVPWNFSAEEIMKARMWVQQQGKLDPDNEGVKAAWHILSDLWKEYCKKTGQDAELPNQPEVNMEHGKGE